MKIKNIVRKKLAAFLKDCMGTKSLLFEQRRMLLDHAILNSKESGITDRRYCDSDIIVSLTTYGKRYYDVAFTIESIMEQTMKANRIILWLEEELQSTPIPVQLQLLQKRGLEIKFCSNIRSYKKLIPTLKLYPDATIITIDDDVLYDSDLLETLIVPYLQNSNNIYAHRIHRMTFNQEGKIAKYKDWDRCINDKTPSFLLFPTGVGGVLYPPHSLDDEVLNEEIFMAKCQFADDVWFKAMSIKKGTKTCGVFSHRENGADYLINESVQDVALFNNNLLGLSLNDTQLKAVFEYYGIYDMLPPH